MNCCRYSQYQRPNNVMGFSVRTDSWRYTEWVDFNYTSVTPNWESVSKYGVEMYAHFGDPTGAQWAPGSTPQFGNSTSFNDFENANVANDPAFAKERESLQQLLRSGPWDPSV